MFKHKGRISLIRGILIFSIFLTIGSCSTLKKSNLSAYKIEGFAQGTSYQITYYAERAVISSIIQKVEY